MRTDIVVLAAPLPACVCGPEAFASTGTAPRADNGSTAPRSAQPESGARNLPALLRPFENAQNLGELCEPSPGEARPKTRQVVYSLRGF
eukprot:5187378-Pleurochrysis_carterae.AAC.2